ncbi:MAG: VWA domain-containing protein [Pyrinomonadaceae bacterium]
MNKTAAGIIGTVFCLLLASTGASGQSRHSDRTVDNEGTILSVTARRTDKKTDPLTAENLYLYENGVQQKIKGLSFDPSPSRIVILVDNSQTVPADIDLLKKATMEFAYEIFDGDQLFVLAYDEKAEIVQEWTDDAKKLEHSLGTFRKKGSPYLFDALSSTVREILVPLMPGTRKTAVVIIGDGVDRGSSTPFETVLSELQGLNVTVYALQLPDRTRGAYKREGPKAAAAIKLLTEGTGGAAFPLDDARAAAKAICDELRRNRYLLSYFPVNTSSYDARRVFLIADEGIAVRSKNAQPPNIKVQ